MRILRKWLLLIAFAPLPAFAQPCGGFTDVFVTDFYCNNVEWMKNRGVTLGVTATEYRPADPTVRAQMAAFMNRLGNILTPIIIRTGDVNVDGTYDPFHIGCMSVPVPPTPPIPGSPPIPGYPRQASFTAALWNYNASAPKLVQAQLVYSTNGGTTWTSTGDFVMSHNLQVGQHATLSLVGGPFDLAVGTTYQFAIRLITLNAGATIEGECQLNVRVENRNPTSSPFDPIL